MSPMYKKPTGPKQPPKTGGPMPRMPKPGGTPGATPKPQIPGVVQAMKEKMRMKGQKGK